MWVTRAGVKSSLGDQGTGLILCYLFGASFRHFEPNAQGPDRNAFCIFAVQSLSAELGLGLGLGLECVEGDVGELVNKYRTDQR